LATVIAKSWSPDRTGARIAGPCDAGLGEAKRVVERHAHLEERPIAGLLVEDRVERLGVAR